MVLDAALFNTLHYKVMIKGKMEQFRERCSALNYISLKESFQVANFTFTYYIYVCECKDQQIR